MLESLFIFLEEMVIKYVEEMLQNDNFIIIKITNNQFRVQNTAALYKVQKKMIHS